MEGFQVTTAIKKLYRLNKRKKVIQGGTSQYSPIFLGGGGT